MNDRMLSRRALLKWAGIAGAAAFAAGCGGTAAPTATTAPKAPAAATSAPAAAATKPAEAPKTTPTGKKVEIRWMGWENPQAYNFQGVIDAFTAKNPNITCTYTFAPDRYTEKLTAMYAAGDPPEIFDVNDDYVLTYACQGLIRPLDDFVAKTGWAKDKDKYFNYYWEFPDMSKWGYGKIMAATSCFWSWMYFVNLDMFTKEGVKPPPTTWSDGGYWNTAGLVEAAKKLTKTDSAGRTTQYGVSIYHSTGCEAIWSFNNGGGTIYAPDGKSFILNEPKGCEAMQWLADLTHVHKVQPDLAVLKQSSAKDLFVAGKLGILFAVTADMPDVMQKVGNTFKWGIAPLEKGAFDQRQEGSSIAWCMAPKCKYPEETWAFLQFLQEETAQKIIATTGGGFPVRKDWANQWYVKPNAMPMYQNVILEAYDHYNAIPKTTNTEKARSLYRPELSLVYNGEKKACPALTGVKPQIDKLLTEKCIA